MKRLLLMILTCALVLSVGCGKKKEAKASKASKESARVEKQEKKSRESADHEDEKEKLSAEERCEEWLREQKLEEGWNEEQKCFVCIVEFSKDEQRAYARHNPELKQKQMRADVSLITWLDACGEFIRMPEADPSKKGPTSVIVSSDNFLRSNSTLSLPLGKLTLVLDASSFVLTEKDIAQKMLPTITHCAIRKGERTVVSMTTVKYDDTHRRFYLNRHSVKDGRTLSRLLAYNGVIMKRYVFGGENMVVASVFTFAEPKKQ